MEAFPFFVIFQNGKFCNSFEEIVTFGASFQSQSNGTQWVSMGPNEKYVHVAQNCGGQIS